MKVRPLKVGEVYVVVDDMKSWKQYPLPRDMVARATITTIYAPVNDSPYVLVHHNFPSQFRQVQSNLVFVFNYDLHSCPDHFGLTPAFE